MDQVTLTEDQLAALQWVSVDYYLKEVNHRNGLIRDKTREGAPASIAASTSGSGADAAQAAKALGSDTLV